MTSRQKCVAAFCKLLQRGAANNGCVVGLPQHTSSSWLSSSTIGQQSVLCRAARQLLSSSRSFASGPTRPGARARQAGAAAAPAAGAGAAGGSSAPAQLSAYEQWVQRFRQIPTVPKWLGLAGAIPFIALAPPVCKHLAPLLPTTISENCAMIQVCYGVVIVTFLGAVHWGVAMASPLTGPVAAKLANDAYVYSVIPSLVAWPVALMEPGPGAMVLSLLLPGCYAADYTRRNLGLPPWYMTLRLTLTVLATFGMLLTATRHVHAELERVKEAEAAAEPAAGSRA